MPNYSSSAIAIFKDGTVEQRMFGHTKILSELKDYYSDKETLEKLMTLTLICVQHSEVMNTLLCKEVKEHDVQSMQVYVTDLRNGNLTLIPLEIG